MFQVVSVSGSLPQRWRRPEAFEQNDRHLVQGAFAAEEKSAVSAPCQRYQRPSFPEFPEEPNTATPSTMPNAARNQWQYCHNAPEASCPRSRARTLNLAWGRLAPALTISLTLL